MPKTATKTVNKMPPVTRQSQSVEEWAAANGVSVHSAYNYLKSGKLPHVRLGRIYRIPLNAMQLMTDANTEKE